MNEVLRFDPFDRSDPIDAPIERRHRVDARRFRTCHQVGLGEVGPVVLIDLEGAQQECCIDVAMVRRLTS